MRNETGGKKIISVRLVTQENKRKMEISHRTYKLMVIEGN